MKVRSCFRFLLLVAIAGCQSSTPKSQGPTLTDEPALASRDQTLLDAKRLFYEAVDGGGGALSEATRLLESLGGAESADPVVVGYIGSCRLLASSKAFLPWEMGRLAKEGLKLQDRAVAAAPDNLDLRALRGLSNSKLPGFFNREATGAGDLAIVASALAKSPEQPRLEPRVAAAALYHHGLFRKRSGDADAAQSAWRLAVSIAPDAPGGRAAAAEVLQDHRVP